MVLNENKFDFDDGLYNDALMAYLHILIIFIVIIAVVWLIIILELFFIVNTVRWFS